MIALGVQLSVGGSSVRDIVDAAVGFEEAGFESVWIGDHFIDHYDQARPVPECFTTLAAIAQATTRIRIGSLAASVLGRDPAVLAQVVGTLADLSDGRFELGLGTGGVKSEFRALGVPFPSPRDRLRCLAESLQLLRALQQGGPVSAEIGERRFTQAWCLPAFGSSRILVAALRSGTARLAGRYADEVNAIDYAQDYDAAAVIAAARKEAGRHAREIAASLLIPDPQEGLIGGGPHPASGVERARALGAHRIIFRVLPPYPHPERLLAERVDLNPDLLPRSQATTRAGATLPGAAPGPREEA